MAAEVRDAGTRQDTFIVIAHLDFKGPHPLGIWDKRTGGAADSDDVKYYPGGMQDQVSLGGRAVNDNIVIQRLYDRIDDHNMAQLLIDARGKGLMTVFQKPMDQDGNASPTQKSLTWHGVLKRVLFPESDSESTSAAMIELEISVSGPPALT